MILMEYAVLSLLSAALAITQRDTWWAEGVTPVMARRSEYSSAG